MAIKITSGEFNKKFGQSTQPTQQQSIGDFGISNAFKGGLSQIQEGYSQAKNATNPLQLLEGGTKLAAGGFNTIYSPLAPVMKPIEMGVNYAAKKISDIPAVQKFAGSKAGEVTSRVAEDIGNLSTVVGGVAGSMSAKPAIETVAKNTVGSVAPTIAKTGRILKASGETAYGITVNPSEGTARAMSSYKESTPNLMTRIKNEVSGNTQGKPITEANTAARYGLMGTEQEIGVQSGRYMKSIWNNKIEPALKSTKGKLDMRQFFDSVEKQIIKETPELTRRNDLLEGLNALKSEYGKVNKVGIRKLQDYKSGWANTLPEATWKGKPIASALKEVKKIASDTARDFIYKNVPESVKQDYIDYGNLKSIKEAGIKSGIGDLAKKSMSRGAWQFIMDKTVTPIATTMGKILYKTGEGLEFIGDSGAKTVGDIVGHKSNPQAGFIKNPFTTSDNVLKELNSLDTSVPTINGKIGMNAMTPEWIRLDELKSKLQNKPLSEKEILEAKNLMKKVFKR